MKSIPHFRQQQRDDEETAREIRAQERVECLMDLDGLDTGTIQYICSHCYHAFPLEALHHYGAGLRCENCRPGPLAQADGEP